MTDFEYAMATAVDATLSDVLPSEKDAARHELHDLLAMVLSALPIPDTHLERRHLRDCALRAIGAAAAPLHAA